MAPRFVSSARLPPPRALADACTILLAGKRELTRRLGFFVTPPRSLILSLAFTQPVHAGDVKAAARSLEGSPVFADVRNLRHRAYAYQIMRRLARGGGLCVTRGCSGRYRLPSDVRGVLAESLRPVLACGVSVVGSQHGSRTRRV